MPAYRSSAEAEIREPVVALLREQLHGCRIIHEINCAVWGPNRIDVMAITEDRIAAVEIKSAKDKLDRLPDQLASMRRCAHHVVAALHAKFFTFHDWKDGSKLANEPNEARYANVWGFGLPANAVGRPTQHVVNEPSAKPMLMPPAGAIDLLWRDELREIVSRHKLVRGPSRLTIPELQDAITWHLPGQVITREICAALRARKCAEADPEITPKHNL